MAETTWDIERIVHAVMQRLAELPVAAAPAVRAAPPAAACDFGDELSVIAPVVSLAALEAQLADRPRPAAAGRVVPVDALAGRLSGLRRLVVRRGAVVTPAVRDLLRQHAVDLVTAIDGRGIRHAEVPLALLTVACHYDPAPLVASLTREVTIARIPASDLVGGVDALAARVGCGGWLGLLVTEQTAAALCLANRHAEVRAAAVAGAEEVDEVTRAIGANVLVVSPADRGTAALAAVARAFCQQGPQPCPAALHSALHRPAKGASALVTLPHTNALPIER